MGRDQNTWIPATSFFGKNKPFIASCHNGRLDLSILFSTKTLGSPSRRGRFSDPPENIVSGAFANGRNFFDNESTHDRPLKSTSNEDKVQPCPSVSSVQFPVS
jgi:hypothetical protein